MANGVVCPHPETIEIAWVLREREKARDPDGTGGLRTWNASRPDFVEADAVMRSAHLAPVTGSRIHIVHTSSAAALEAGVTQRQAGASISIATCPHYLRHDEDWGHGNIAKINPPLRTRRDCDALWRGIADGHVDIIGTDHIHRDVASKAGSVWTASPGCPGLETMLPVMLSEGHHKRGIGLTRIAALTAGNAAQAMGLSHCKGAISVGLDADFAVVDLNAEWTPDASCLRSSAGYSIYEGSRFRGRTAHTILRGEFIMRDRELDDAAVGKGRYLTRRI